MLNALKYLLENSDLYKEAGIQIDEEWLNKMNQDKSCECKELLGIVDSQEQLLDSDDEASDNFSEVDDTERVMGNMDTILEETDIDLNRLYTFAPGEGQTPLGIFQDTDSEYLSFPSIFCGKRRADNKDREKPVHYSDICKWELRSKDRRVAMCVPNLFFKMKKLQLKQINDKIGLSIRRCKTSGKKLTAKQLLEPDSLKNLVNLDEGYYIFRTIRNSPAYLEKRKKDVFAMIRQLGLPTWFASFSAADTQWNDLLKMIGILLDNHVYNDQEIEQMDWQQRTRLLQSDPVTCARYFDNRVSQFIKLVLKVATCQ